ncbi:hypothetical protein [Ignavibacterium album]|uniref:hypothetical protein n=1 Tax=Ignavibacterium album TaxID=591197 RepID=UPI0038B3F3C5
MIIQITARTLVTFFLLSGLIMSSFQEFILLLNDFFTIISSLRDLSGRGFLILMKQDSE